MVKTCQMAGDKPHRGDPIGKMPGLWPVDALKRRALHYARLFQQSMRLRGYEPLQAETAMELWGPYTEKVPLAPGPDYVPEEGNPLIKDKQSAYPVYGYRGDELRVDKGIAFRIRGRFLADTKHGQVEEEKGVVII